MPWDPLGAWPNERRWICLTIAGWVLLLHGPAFVENLQAKPPRDIVPDFSRNMRRPGTGSRGGRSTHHHETVPRFLGVKLNDQHSHVFVNAHPPRRFCWPSPSPGSLRRRLPRWNLDFARGAGGEPLDRAVATEACFLALVVHTPGRAYCSSAIRCGSNAAWASLRSSSCC